MKHIRLVIVLAFAALVLTACGGSDKPSSVPDDAVAVVGGDTISKEDYNKILEQAQRCYKAQHKPFPKAGTQAYTTLRAQIIQFLVERSEYEQVAKDKDVKVSDKEVEDRLNQVKQQYFDDHKAQYQQPALPESRDVRHILVKSHALALTVYKKLKGGADFEKLALKYSVDPSKTSGGRLTVCKERTVTCQLKTVPPFEKTAFSLKTNEISKPVHTRFGWHVIQALGPVNPAKKKSKIPFDQVKAAIKQTLEQQKKQDAFNKWWKDTKKDFSKKTKFRAGYQPPASQTSTR